MRSLFHDPTTDYIITIIFIIYEYVLYSMREFALNAFKKLSYNEPLCVCVCRLLEDRRCEVKRCIII